MTNHNTHPFKPLDTKRLQEMAAVAVTHNQRVPLLVMLKRALPQAATSKWALAPAGAFAAVLLVMFALYAPSNTQADVDWVANIEQADLLVMLEENLR